MVGAKLHAAHVVPSEREGNSEDDSVSKGAGEDRRGQGVHTSWGYPVSE